MNFYSKYIIRYDERISSALEKLNTFHAEDSLTLFVVDITNKVIGTLTDGDIRRALVSGFTLNRCLKDVANKSFFYLLLDSYDVKQIIAAKKNGIELLPVLNKEGQIVDAVNLKLQKSYLPIDAILMAGGKGERLRPLTANIPKPLLPLGGRPIIDYIVEHLISFGINNINITVNYLHEQIEEHFSKDINGIQIKTIKEPCFLGTIGGVQFVENFTTDTVLLMNSDAITDLNLESFYLHFKEHDADMSIAAIPYNISVPYGIFELDGRNIKGVLEKPTYNYYANSGIYLIKRELLNLIPRNTFFNATDFLELLVAQNYKVIRFPLNGTWLDIGSPQEYQKAEELLKHR